MHQVSTEDKQSLQKGQNATLDISNHGLTVINESGCAIASHVDIADSQNRNAPVGQSKTAFINESGLYSLILSSKLPTAKKFKRWVTSEVLPAIQRSEIAIFENHISVPN